jgi:hypothetical protein
MARVKGWEGSVSVQNSGCQRRKKARKLLELRHVGSKAARNSSIHTAKCTSKLLANRIRERRYRVAQLVAMTDRLAKEHLCRQYAWRPFGAPSAR